MKIFVRNYTNNSHFVGELKREKTKCLALLDILSRSRVGKFLPEWMGDMNIKTTVYLLFTCACVIMLSACGNLSPVNMEITNTLTLSTHCR